jgi:hypothetical protein
MAVQIHEHAVPGLSHTHEPRAIAKATVAVLRPPTRRHALRRSHGPAPACAYHWVRYASLILSPSLNIASDLTQPQAVLVLL